MPLATQAADPLPWLIALYAWLFAVGGAVGSFLNVVVYRLPLGMSLVEPGSHCPACKHPIRWFDNVPILSWFVLGGRCRDCRARISFRYPLVEATTAVLFLVLGVAELSAAYPYHLLLLCTLLVAVLIECDGQRLPAGVFVPAIVAAALAPLVWPSLRPVHAVASLHGWSAGLIDGAAGLASGAVLGLLAFAGLGALGQQRQRGMLFGPACVGLFLGWQAAVALTITAAAIALAWLGVGRLLRARLRIPAITWLAVATLAWILLQEWLLARWPLMG